MRISSLFVAAAVALFALAPQSALAGSITGATGPIKVNDKARTLRQGEKLELEEGDRVEAGKSTVTWTSASGDVLTLEPGTSALATGTTDERDADGKEFKIEYLFLEWGAATGQISTRTSLGTSAGWMGTPGGAKAKTTVFVEVPERTKFTKSQFRAVKGTAWVRYHKFRVGLNEGHSIVLTVDPNDPNTLGFRTGQQNRSEVEVILDLSRDNRIVAKVPRATSGSLSPEVGNKTKVANDITSLKTGKIEIETRFAGREPKTAQLGPGTSARIDNETGDIQVAFEAVAFEILESAIMLTSEFSTIAQSNFADVK